MSLKYWLLLFLLGVGWGSSFFFNEVLLRELGALTIGLGRLATGALGCWVWLIAMRKPLRVSREMLGVLFVFGIVQYAIPLTAYPYTQQFITSSAAGIVNAMTPIMVVIISHFWPMGERLTPAKAIGVLLGFAGIVILAVPSFQGQGESNPWALLATMTAPICYGISINYVRKMDGLNRVLLTAWSLTLGTLVMAPVALSIDGLPELTRLDSWLALAIQGFVLTAAAFILMFWLVPRVGATAASTVTFIAPISAVLLGIFVLGEELFVVQYIGMAVIFIGLLCIDGRLWRRLAGAAR